MSFDVDEVYFQSNQMFFGKSGKGRGYYLKRRMLIFYAFRHPLIVIKLIVNFIKA